MKYLISISLLIALCACSHLKDELPPPNIVWITIEDLSPMLGAYGDATATTPHLDAFAKQSIRYTNAFSTAPVCSPSRSCIITGLYASSLGSMNLRSEVKLPPSIIPYPKYLRQAGYYTTNNSKEDYNFIDTTIWDNSSNKAHWRDRKPGQPFFSVFNLLLTHQSSIFGDDSVYEKRIHPFLPHITPTAPDQVHLPPYYPDTPMIRKLWARYYTNVAIIDYQFSKIIEELEADGLAESTIVFFYSDHGTGVPRHKRALHDSGMKIPFMIHLPEKYAAKFKFTPNTVNDKLISFIDLAPTLFEMTGIAIPEDYPGKPIISSAGKVVERSHLYGASDRVDEGFDLSRSIRTKKYLYIRNFLPHLPLLQPNWYTDHSEIMMELNRVRHDANLTQPQKDMFAPRRPLEELYDVDNDPYQLHNLATRPEYNDTLKEYRNTLREEILKNADTGFAPEPELFRLSKETTPFEFARKQDHYPLKKILAVNDLVLQPETAAHEMIRHLDDPDGLVRYWAIMGLRTLHIDNEEVEKKLNALLMDEFPCVQIEAAKLLIERGDQKAASTISKHMLSGDEILVLFACRSFQQVAKKLKQIPPDAHKAYEKLLTITDHGRLRNKFYPLYSYWALTYVFEPDPATETF